jgi:outer membrane receptor protein involved in Fe transport
MKIGFLTSGAPLAAVLAFVSPLVAQRPPQDSVVPLGAIVVTADRAGGTLGSSVAAVSVIDAAQLARTPNTTVADALRQVPGFALIGFDGLGYDPQVMVRGFYGGGEAEYVVVLVDGRPVNDVQSGVVAWDAIPLSAVERIEVVRGGASALWGDAAIGGVINVITRQPRPGATRWSLSGGSHDSWRTSADVSGTLFGRAIDVFGGVDKTEGFRANAARTTTRFGGTAALISRPDASLRLSALVHSRSFDQPGPLLGDALAADRSASDIFYRFDRAEDRSVRAGVDGETAAGGRARLSAALSGELRDTETARTIALAPEFADTKERDLRTGRALANAQLTVEGTGLPVNDRVVLGVDGSYGTIDSEYFAVLTGDRGAYAGSVPRRGELDASGTGDRLMGAAFAQYTLLPVDAVRISVGARADWLRDTFEPDGAARIEADHSAFSPKVGVNVRYLRGEMSDGHVYATAGRSFKAPTLDQLFDQRTLPVPFPPFAVTTSSALLEPQHGTNLEAGVYHGATFSPGGATAMLSLAVYQMDMENELDFDVQTLKYVNIGESRHRGVEAGLQLQAPRAGNAFVNYTQQSATSRSGEDAGKQLKAIPRHSITAGATASLGGGGLEAGMLVSHARDIFLDDANTLTLPSFTRVDARVSYPFRGMQVFVDVRNVFDAKFSTTGFPDPSGSGAVYYHPAAGRTFELGVRGGF